MEVETAAATASRGIFLTEVSGIETLSDASVDSAETSDFLLADEYLEESPEESENNEILELERIRALKARLGFDAELTSNGTPDKMSSPLVDAQELQDRLASVRTKLTPRNDPGSSSYVSPVNQYSSGNDGSSRPSLADLARTWKEMNSERVDENAFSVEPFSEKTTATGTRDESLQAVGARPSWSDLAAEWKMLNSEKETNGASTTSLDEYDYSIKVDASENSEQLSQRSVNPSSWADMAREAKEPGKEQFESTSASDVSRDESKNDIYQQLAKEWAERNRGL